MIHLFLFTVIALAFSPERIPSTNPPPAARAFALMVNFPPLNLIMIYGGYSDPTNSIYGDIWAFNFLEETWTRSVPSDGVSPAGRYSGGSFGLVDRSMYCIFGGMSLAGPLNDLWCFQAKGFLWDQIITTGDQPSPRMRFGFTSFLDENQILHFVVMGGITLSGVDNNLYILDTSTWIWTKKEALGEAPLNLEGNALVYYRNKLFTAGGENTNSIVSKVETLYYFDLDTNDNKWHNATSKNTYTSRVLGGYFMKNSELHLMMGYSVQKSSFVSTWYKVDLESGPDYDWEEVPIAEDIDDSLVIDSYGFTWFEDSLYIFGGDQRPPVINRLAVFNISNSPITFRVYDGNYSPTPRMYHSMQPIGQYLYLFGGLGDKGELYNDFWSYDVIKEKWELIIPQGDVPSKRYGYASAVSADVMLIWGGYGEDGYLSDGYLYDISSGKFRALEYTGDAPGARVGACAGLSGWLIFIYGGKTDAGLSDELWTYDITTKQYNLINSGDEEGPGPLYYATCRVAASRSSFLWVMYGEAKDDTPTNQIYGYESSQSTWYEYNDDSTNSTYSRSRAAVCKPLQRVLVVGGEMYGLFPHTEIFYFSTVDFEFTMLGDIPESFFAPASTYFQNYFYIHGGGTSATSLLRFSVPSNIFLRLPMWSFCSDNTTCNFACSYGSYMTSSSCELCPLGTYSDEFGLTACKKCPQGTYGPNFGATSLDMCYPCPDGEYNSYTGQGHCFDCPHTSTCRAGSKDYDYKTYTYDDSYIQPAIYSADAEEARKNNMIIGIVVGVIGLLVVIVMLFLRKVEAFLLYFDIYADMHNHFIGEPMYLKRTKIGGIFGIIFIFLAIIIIGVEVVNYAQNNIYETKSLIPLVVLEQDTQKFEGNFYIAITLMNYGAACDDGPCSSSNIYTDITGITGNWTETVCKQEKNGDCSISTLCKKCSVSKQGIFAITMDDTNGYTSGFAVNLTSSSSIPQKSSSYKTYVLPDEKYIFIGSDPTRIYFDMIPSYYEDTEETGNHTGYHVSLEKNSHQGAQFKPYELGLAYINYLTIYLDVDNNGLVTTRYYNQTWILLLTALLSSIFGVIGTIGGIMKFVEKHTYLTFKRIKHKKYLEQLEKDIRLIKKLRKDPDFKPLKEADSPASSKDASEKDRLNSDE